MMNFTFMIPFVKEFYLHAWLMHALDIFFTVCQTFSLFTLPFHFHFSMMNMHGSAGWFELEYKAAEQAVFLLSAGISGYFSKQKFKRKIELV